MKLCSKWPKSSLNFSLILLVIKASIKTTVLSFFMCIHFSSVNLTSLLFFPTLLAVNVASFSVVFESMVLIGKLLFLSFELQLNPDVNVFQRKFVNEVRRCEEMDRKLSKLLSQHC